MLIQKPKISVVVPVYNVEFFLEQCVKSIIAQTHTNLQIILVDDGSKDSSGVLCDKLKEQDTRIEVVHKSNGGLSSARNAGLDIAEGDYISFIDSDDFIAPTMYEQMLNVFAQKNCDIVSCSINRYYYREGIYKPYIHYNYTEVLTDFKKSELERLHILCQIDCSVCNKLFKRDIIINERFKDGITNEDFLFFYYLYKKVNKFSHLNKPLYFYRYTEGSISNSFNDKSFDIIDNGLVIRNDIIYNNIEELKPAIDRYLYSMCFSYSLIIRYKCKNNEFVKRYEQLYDLLNNHLGIIRSNPYFSNINKLTIIVFVRYTFAFDLVYKILRFIKQFRPRKSTQMDVNRI